MMYVVKRNGTKVPFDKEKIIKAINSALIEVDGELYETDTAEDIAAEIEQKVEKFYDRNLNASTYEEAIRELNRGYSVEDIQNLVEDYLMQSERRDVAKAYIRFRYKREIAREQKDIFFNAISEKLEARNVKKQNANVDEQSFGGRMGEATDVMTKQYALDYCVSKMARENHLNNEIYIHDLSHYAVGDHNCLSIPFDNLLAKGFNTRQTDVRPAGSLSTAFQLVAVIFQLQSLQQFGGVSATHLDWTMVPYVRKSFMKHMEDGMKYIDKTNLEPINANGEIINKTAIDWMKDFDISRERFGCSDQVYQYALDMTQKEIYQAVEGLYHNLK